MSEYGAGNIKVLKGLEAVRKRPGMYIGDTNINGLHHLIYEAVDNSIDESMAGYCNEIEVALTKSGSAIVKDNGRGIPVDIHPTEGISAATVVLTVLHAGGKFDKDTYKVSGGLHGVGISVVNALSSKFHVTIHRDGNIHEQDFEKGIPQNELTITGKTKITGTIVEFWPDNTIFETVDFQFDILSKRFKELAYLNPKITITLNDERENKKEVYKFEGGIGQFVEDISTKTAITKVISFSDRMEDIEADIALLYNESYDEKVYSFVNNIKTADGGTHESGFRAGLTRAITAYIEANANTREKETKITGDDVREGLVAIVSVRVPEPQFEGQTKGKLGSSYVRPLVQKLTYEKLAKYFEENPIEARAIMNKALLAAKGREAAKKARDLTRKKESMTVGTLPGKLADCQSKDSAITELYLVEGDSAGGSAKQGRNRVFQAILPLKGKILNVEKSGLDKILKSDEIKNIITALGCGIGDEFDPEKLRYGKLIIMTDADVDGSHIQTLLLTFFYRFLNPLIQNGNVYIAQPPLYRYKKGKKEIYLKDSQALSEFLIENGIESLEVEEKDYKELKDILRVTAYYRNILEELKKRYSLVKVVQRLIENEELLALDNDALFADLDAYITKIGFNILSKTVDEEKIHLFVQTDAGLEEIIVDDNLFTNHLFAEAIHIYNKLKEKNLSLLGGKDYFEVLSRVEESAKKGAYIQRYKGLGEMNPEQLWETTMNPQNRRLIKVTVENISDADSIFTLFMGDEVEPRRKYIEEHAKDVKHLDV
ncbi:MAG: DNA topoisomerase (ATP-hydrolyzing) subunit B [Campylobacteraceae bacterium]|nr:DNA topoisomerase (ATP-hydrolyzing) subunit B [Campylobacteraceae bacterium]